MTLAVCQHLRFWVRKQGTQPGAKVSRPDTLSAGQRADWCRARSVPSVRPLNRTRVPGTLENSPAIHRRVHTIGG